MARHWRCTRCGTFHGATSRFQDEPDECRECGYAEFETLGNEDPEGGGFQLGRLLNLDTFTWLAMGIAIYNVIFAMLGGFAGTSALMYSAGVSFVTMLVVAYLLSNRTRASWVLAVVVFVGVVLWGVVIVLPWLFQQVGLAAPPIPDFSGEDIFLAYGFLYVFFGLVGLAMLVGGRDAVERHGESAEDVAG